MSVFVLAVDMRLLRDLPPTEPILAAAADLRAAATGFLESISSMRNKWSALDTLYSGPGRDKVLQAMDRPSQQAEDHQESVSSTVDALNEFASELAEIDAERIALKERIEEEESRLEPIATKMASGEIPDWDGGYELMAKATAAFQAEVAVLEDRYERARAACESALSAVSRVSSPVVSEYDSPQMDLESEGAADLAASFANATKPDASEEDIAAFYRLLGEMGPAEVAAFAAAVPAASLFIKGMGAYQEASFWKSLSPSQREGLAKSMPGLVGNLEGAPYAVRHEANLLVLEEVMSVAHDATEEQREAYRSIQEALKGDGGRTPMMLISFEPGHAHPLAAISVGNLDKADNVTYLVPGMDNYSTDPGDMGSLVNGAFGIAKEQRASDPEKEIVDEQGSTRGKNHVVVAYMGYDTPGKLSVLQDGHATRGAQDFANALDGLYLTRTADGLAAPDVNVVAHSYGTTMTTKALTQTLYPITSAVYIGSAGVDEGVRAEDLKVDRGWDGNREIYVSTADDGDVLAPVGISGTRLEGSMESDHRIDPTMESWGGRGFSSNTTTLNGDEYVATEKHDMREYLDPESSALRGIVMATLGQGRELMENSVEIKP